MRPRHRIFWFLIFFPSLSIRKRKHIIFCSFVLFSWHFDYTSHGCMTVNLFGAYNIYNITFGNCDKDNSINCHDLLPLSGKKNLKINKKNTLPDQNPTVCVYIYIYTYIYMAIQATIRELSSTALDYMEAIPGIPVYLPIFRSQFGCMGFPEKKKVIPASSLNQLRMTQD